MKSFSLIIFSLLVIGRSECADILGFFPHPGKSHFDVFQVLMEELAERGHNVTVVSFFPHKNPPKGYSDISLVGLHPIYVHIVDFEKTNQQLPAWIQPIFELKIVSDMGISACEAILPSPQIQQILKSKFDLVVMEQFDTDCFLPIVHKLKVPYVAMSSCFSMPWLLNRMGNPTHPGYFPSIFLPMSDRASLWDKIQNTMIKIIFPTLYDLWANRPVLPLVEKIFGEVPPLEDLARNTSLLLVNTHFTLHQPMPLLPGVVEVGGMHIKEAKPLPKDLETFINEAKDGVILFSLGSMLRAETFPEEKVQAFINVFRKLPQRIIWKINGEIPDLPPNVLKMDWLPQRDILGHKNVLAFIAHGGLLGMTEGVYSGKPLVTIPMFGDQPNNVAAAVEAGVAVRLAYTDINEENVRNAITKALSKEMRKNAQDLADAFKDRPTPPLEEAVFWTEYVLRRGGQYLRPATVDMSFIEYYLIDVASVIIAAIIIIIISLKSILCLIKRLVCVSTKRREKQD